MSKSTTPFFLQQTPLLNHPSVVSPLIHLHNVCLVPSLACENEFICSVVVSDTESGMCELTNQTDLLFGSGGLKETERFRWRKLMHVNLF